MNNLKETIFGFFGGGLAYCVMVITRCEFLATWLIVCLIFLMFWIFSWGVMSFCLLNKVIWFNLVFN